MFATLDADSQVVILTSRSPSKQAPTECRSSEPHRACRREPWEASTFWEKAKTLKRRCQVITITVQKAVVIRRYETDIDGFNQMIYRLPRHSDALVNCMVDSHDRHFSCGLRDGEGVQA